MTELLLCITTCDRVTNCPVAWNCGVPKMWDFHCKTGTVPGKPGRVTTQLLRTPSCLETEQFISGLSSQVGETPLWSDHYNTVWLSTRRAHRLNKARLLGSWKLWKKKEVKPELGMGQFRKNSSLKGHYNKLWEFTVPSTMLFILI